jgi:hypothetical protein
MPDRPWGVGFRLAGVATIAVAVEGYHLGADDAAIYIPAIKRAADPALYSFGDEFFLSHARLSLFPKLVGGAARISHLPVDAVLLGWHWGGILLLLTAAWLLLGRCFERPAARWCGVCLLAGVLSVPVAGTALAIMDPYLTARSLSTPLILMAMAAWLWRRPGWAAVCLALGAAVHPQMAVYGLGLIGSGAWVRWRSRPKVGAPALGMASMVPLSLDFSPVTGAARECLLSRTYFFIATWAWYEWLGVVAPLGLLLWWARWKGRNTRAGFGEIAGSAAGFGVMSTLASVLLEVTPRLESFHRLQPMRGLHVVYVIFFCLLGGLLGEFVLQSRVVLWVAVFVPLAAGMVLVDRVTYPASPHVELPGATGGNPWLAAFFWIRRNTPEEALFAMDSRYMAVAGEDEHGFRAVAERSVLADSLKDSGVVSLFPALAGEWSREVAATSGLDGFGAREFGHLQVLFPVTWVVIRRPPAFLQCPYRNGAVSVCRLGGRP